MYLLKSFSCQINILLHWTRILAPLTVIPCFLLASFHAALFKYIFRSTKVDFVVFTMTFVLLKQAETKVMNKRSIFDSKTLRWLKTVF